MTEKNSNEETQEEVKSDATNEQPSTVENDVEATEAATSAADSAEKENSDATIEETTSDATAEEATIASETSAGEVIEATGNGEVEVVVDSATEQLEGEKAAVEAEAAILENSTNDVILDETGESDLEEEDFDDEDLEEEEPKGKFSKHIGTILYSLLGLVVVAVLIFGYYVFPFYSKIGGTWTGSNSAGNFKIVNKGDKSEFSFIDMNGISGMDLVFTSTLNRKGINEYDVKDTGVTIVLNKKKVGDENVKQFKALTDQVKVKSETKKEVVLTYTKAAYKSAFAEVDIDAYFNYRLTNFNLTLQGQDLMLKNDEFATPEVSFTHK